MPQITIETLEQERRFTEYHRRRGELRDALRNGVYPNLVVALRIHKVFVADYGPGGAHYDEVLWKYYLSNLEPIAAQQATMISAAEAIVQIMEAVELAAPGTFDIEVPVKPEPDPKSES